MNRIILQIILGLVLIFIHQGIHAQNRISLSPTQSVALEFTAPFEPGSPIEAVMDQSKWLDYSITVTPPAPPVSISAEITSGSMAAGLEMQLQAGTYNGTGANPGVPTGTIVLTSTPQVIISGIGTCTSEVGIHIGHPLTYTLRISDYSLVKASSATINVLFTITQ